MELPKSWVWTNIQSIIVDGPQNGLYLPQSVYGTGVPILRIDDFQDDTSRSSTELRLVSADKEDIARFSLRQGDLVINRVNSPSHLGKCLFVSDRNVPSLFESNMMRLRLTESIDAKFVAFYLRSSLGRSRLISNAKWAVNQASINQKDVNNTLLPLPPLAEQRRIVSAIEQQFSRLDAGVAALQRAKAKLKRYRAAVLKAAVGGKLTEIWRAEHPTVEPASALLERILKERRAKWEADLRAKGKDPAKVKYVEPAAVDEESLPELPEGWFWANVEQVSHFVRYGSSSKTSEDATGLPVLRMGNIQEGSLDLTNLKYLPVNHPEFPNLLLEIGDLLFNRTNSPELVGKSAVYHGNPTLCSYASYLISVRMLEGCLADYLCFFLNSSYGKVWIASVVSQQVGQANVNGSKLQALAFPLPPFIEQVQIVAEVERNLSLINQLEASVELNLKRAERLRHSILREAFAGRLVPQDPTDEPAGVLLERIQSERNGQKNGIGVNNKKSRSVRVPESVAMDVVDAEQIKLWESVGH